MTNTDSTQTPVISVVIPTYNRCQWLKVALESVLQETRVPLLVHVFDNASTDGTRDLIQGLIGKEPRLRYTRHASNIGGLPNTNLSVRSVETSYFVPLADDDWLYPDFLYEAYGLMRKNPALGAIIYQTKQVYPNGFLINPASSRPSGFLDPKTHLIDWMEFGHYQWSSILWNRKVLEVTGVPEDAVGYPSDVDFQAQAFCYFPVLRVAKLGAAYRVHPLQASHPQASSKLLEGNWRLIRRRLDRSVRLSSVMPWNEYLLHRPALLRYWRSIWTAVLDDKSLTVTLKMALKFGIQFRDVEFCFSSIEKKLQLWGRFQKARSRVAFRSRVKRGISRLVSLTGSSKTCD
jgi:glycosyltransferase involved in cell wall biosynthesis